jgi:hypothetical protein
LDREDEFRTEWHVRGLTRTSSATAGGSEREMQ